MAGAPNTLPKLARGRWGDDETKALIEAWKPLYQRRCQGEIDPWVAARWHGLVRSKRCLVAADWRVVAAAVNASRDRVASTRGYHRTHGQCRDRMEALRDKFSSDNPHSPCRFFTELSDVLRPASQPSELAGRQDDVVAPSAVGRERRFGDVAEDKLHVDVPLQDGSVGGDWVDDASTMTREPVVHQKVMVEDGAVKEGRDVNNVAEDMSTSVEPAQQECGIGDGVTNMASYAMYL